MEAALVSVVSEPPVGEIVIDRPGRLNALNEAVRRALAQAFEELESDPAVKVVVLAGSGGRAFAAGADVEELINLDPVASERLSLSIMAFHERIRSSRLATIASIEGWCLGGGLELALAADIRVASAAARLGLPEVTLGIAPGGGGMARLGALVGAANARAMCLTGEAIDAQRALEIGLVWKVVEPDALRQETQKLAARLGGYSAVALHQIKSALDIAGQSDLSTAQRAEAKACALCFGTHDQREAMVRFLEKRR